MSLPAFDRAAAELFDALDYPGSVEEFVQAVRKALDRSNCQIIPVPGVPGAPNRAEALEADPMAYCCPECGAVKPPLGVSYTQAEVPGMGELIYATLFCGKCRVILNTQILELQSATLAAQKAGFAPPNPSKLWTPGGRGN